MAREKTLSIIKPDAVTEVEAIYQNLRAAGLEIIASKKDYKLTVPEAEQFYTEHRGKGFFQELIQFMTSGPICLQILEGDNAIQYYRQLIGNTDPTKAAIGTLRTKFGGKKLPANALHGSDSVESARREIGFFFPEHSIL
jgi:nucleoside-diphosphate kinase